MDQVQLAGNANNQILTPKVVNDIFPEHLITHLKKSCQAYLGDSRFYDAQCGRVLLSEMEVPQLTVYSRQLTPIVRKLFRSNTLVPSYALFAHYESENANLKPHKDKNACTYTLDVCLYANTSWPLFVEGKAYELRENQALAFYGEQQLHWRESFPAPSSNQVGMVFFHFVEPTHWFYEKGPDFFHVKKNSM